MTSVCFWLFNQLEMQLIWNQDWHHLLFIVIVTLDSGFADMIKVLVNFKIKKTILDYKGRANLIMWAIKLRSLLFLMQKRKFKRYGSGVSQTPSIRIVHTIWGIKMKGEQVCWQWGHQSYDWTLLTPSEFRKRIWAQGKCHPSWYLLAQWCLQHSIC